MIETKLIVLGVLAAIYLVSLVSLILIGKYYTYFKDNVLVLACIPVLNSMVLLMLLLYTVLDTISHYTKLDELVNYLAESFKGWYYE